MKTGNEHLAQNTLLYHYLNKPRASWNVKKTEEVKTRGKERESGARIGQSIA